MTRNIIFLLDWFEFNLDLHTVLMFEELAQFSLM
jgi:hypothetical protein